MVLFSHSGLIRGVLAAAWVFLLAGCPGGRDFDGDGSPDDQDCAPLDPTIGTGLPEIDGDGVDQDCNGEIDEAGGDQDNDGCGDSSDPDADGDGFGAEGWQDLPCASIGTRWIPAIREIDEQPAFDCDDLDASFAPGAAEFCGDEADTDCDGSLADEFTDTDGDDQPDCYDIDADGDGFCAEDADEADCVDQGLAFGDCNDLEPEVYPDAAEACDGFDTNCDDEIPFIEEDEDGDGDPSCSDCDDLDGSRTTEDEDRDGYTTCGVAENEGDPPSDWIDRDCDDDDQLVYPGAVEACDEVDADCDGRTDDDAADNSFADTDGDGRYDCFDQDDDGDGFLDASDCLPLNGDAFPGAEESCDAIDSDCDGSLVDGFPDVDADGIPDCIDTDADTDSDGWPDPVDCGPDNPDAYPGAVELCDGLDTDCNGQPNADALGELDLDGDGSFSCDDCDDLDEQNAPGQPELCDGVDNDCNGSPDADADGEVDVDGDGALSCVDCDDEDPDFSPLLPELCNGLDDDCSGAPDAAGLTETDGDGDSFLDCDDCDDAAPAINPDAAEVPYDGVDDDCDGADLLDVDGDGFDGVDSDGDGEPDDCDDSSAATAPGMADDPFDGIDANCDGVDGEDADGDGWPSTSLTGLAPWQQAVIDCDDGDDALNLDDVDGDGVSTCGGDCDDDDATVDVVDVDGDGVSSCLGDCDDSDATVMPGATELCNGVDDDCDPSTTAAGGEVDGDLDTFFSCEDCDDASDLAYPGAVETPYDGVDQDCSGADLLDGDGDGFDSDAWGGTDCNDSAPLTYPGAPDAPFDGVDRDCDGTDGVDADGDGWPWLASPSAPWQQALLDCDDADAAVNPGSVEACDGLDEDCNGVVDDGFDVDGDGYSPCGLDCDDNDDTLHPEAIELCDGIDNDCDPTTDELSDGDGDGDALCDGDCQDDDAAAGYDPANTPPTPEPGGNRTISRTATCFADAFGVVTCPCAPLTLEFDASGADPDGDPVGYGWSVDSVPSGYASLSPTAQAATTVVVQARPATGPGLTATVTATLDVTAFDCLGSSTETVTVTLNCTGQ